MGFENLPWAEREKLLTAADRQAIQRAIYTRWEDIEESWAETEAGRFEIHRIVMRKYHDEEFKAGMI